MLASRTDSSPKKLAKPAGRWLRAESGMARSGLMFAGVLVAVLGASSWWTLDSYRSWVRESRQDQTEAVGALLVQTLQVALATDEISAARRVVSDIGLEQRFATCSVRLGDGTIVADADPSRVTQRDLPADWPPMASSAIEAPSEGEHVSLMLPLLVPKHGQAMLVIEAPIEYPLLANFEVQTGVALIAAAGLAGLLLTYRAIKRDLGPLTGIRTALHSFNTGERSPEVLAVPAAKHAEALAWNQFVQEHESLRHRKVLDRATERRTESSTEGSTVAPSYDALWLGVVLIDESVRVRYVNRAAAAMLQASSDALVGQSPQGWLANDKCREIIGQVLSGDIRHKVSITLDQPGPAHAPKTGDTAAAPGGVIRVTVVPIRQGGGLTAFVVLEDITQQRIADESRTGFVTQTVHELRSPLTNFRLYLEMLVDCDESDVATRTKALNVLGQESRRLERMVEDMLSMSQMQAGRLEIITDDVRVDALLDDLRTDYEAQAQSRRQTLTFQLPPKIPVIQGDRDKLTLVLHNLLANAIKYTPLGGKVSLAVRETEESGRGWLIIDIADNGMGIRAEECELIFERFYRAKDERVNKITGTGLGLALAREVARFHGGDVTVKSAIDQGSTFTLKLPLAQGTQSTDDKSRHATAPTAKAA